MKVRFQHIVHLFLLFICFGSSRAQEFTPDQYTSLLLHFNESLLGAAGELPADTGIVNFTDGKFGKGAFLDTNSVLYYTALNNINLTNGSIEFWIKPNWKPEALIDRWAFQYGISSGILIGVHWSDWKNVFWEETETGSSENIVTKTIYSTWKKDKWHHTALCWDDTYMSCYIDGLLVDRAARFFTLNSIKEKLFRIGSDYKGNAIEAVIDEFRISTITRSELEIANSFINGLTFDNLRIELNNDSMYQSWQQTPKAVTIINSESINIPIIALTWSSSDPNIISIDENNRLIAHNLGSATITASLGSISASKEVKIISPLLDPVIEEIDPSMANPALGAVFTIPVVIVRYIPTNDGTNINPDYYMEIPPTFEYTLEQLRTDTDKKEKQLKFILEEGSKYHGYKNSGARPSLGYKAIYIISYYEPLPSSDEGVYSPIKNKWFYTPEYNQIMERINARYFVEELGVKEFWIWGYSPQPESNMSCRSTGDISTSSGSNSDLPIYSQAYTVYGYNSFGTVSEIVRTHGHQLEKLLSYVDLMEDGSNYEFVKSFMGRDDSGVKIMGRCGSTNSPPNTTIDFDYLNLNLFASDCENWNPGKTGELKIVNANTWRNLSYNWNTSLLPGTDELKTELQYYIYWMQNIPGFANRIQYDSNWMTNWWLFTADWDYANDNHIGLYSETPTTGLSTIDIIPEEFHLYQNYPNPFNPTSKIKFQIPISGLVELSVYDLLGRKLTELVNEEKPAGIYEVEFDGSSFASGIYFYSLTCNGFKRVNKMTLLK